MQLRWPHNPMRLQVGEVLELAIRLENSGDAAVEFDGGFLALFGRLFNESGEEMVTPGFRIGRKLPRRHYVIEPGQAESIGVYCYLAPHDQTSLPAGRYTMVLPLGDARDEFMNSLLTTVQVDPPEPLVIEMVDRTAHA